MTSVWGKNQRVFVWYGVCNTPAHEPTHSLSSEDVAPRRRTAAASSGRRLSDGLGMSGELFLRKSPPPAGLAFFALLLSSCGVHHVAPRARVAFESEAMPRSVLALPSSCTESAEVRRGVRTCTHDRENAVDEIVRVALEFAGHLVVDSERIDPVASRDEKVWLYERRAASAPRVTMDHLTGTLRGALDELGVEGVLTTSVVGGPVRMGLVEWIEVQIQLSRMDSGRAVWRSHCRAMVSQSGRLIRSMARGLEEATACAIEAPGVLRRRSAGVTAP